MSATHMCRERCAELVVRAEHVLCVLPCLHVCSGNSVEPETELDCCCISRNFSQTRGQQPSRVYTYTHTMCMYICVCFVTTQTELSDVLLLCVFAIYFIATCAQLLQMQFTKNTTKYNTDHQMRNVRVLLCAYTFLLFYRRRVCGAHKYTTHVVTQLRSG